MERRNDGVVPVVPASRLVGAALRSAGEEAGLVRQVLIDLARGQVESLLVGSGGALVLGDAVVAVPWSVVRSAVAGGPIEVTSSVGDLAALPHLPADTTLTVLRTGMPRMVVDRQVVSTMAAPVVAGEVVGDTVLSRKGTEIGALEEVMLDARDGRVAYVLVARGGFLGLGQEWVPLPLAVLSWQPDRHAYVFEGRAFNGDRLGGFPRREELPRSISRSELAELYEKYGADPYWQ